MYSEKIFLPKKNGKNAHGIRLIMSSKKKNRWLMNQVSHSAIIQSGMVQLLYTETGINPLLALNRYNR